MRLPRSLTAGAVMAGTALALYVRRRHQCTGEGYLQILKQLPSDAQRWATTTRERAVKAIEDGKTAAQDREDQLTRKLEAAVAPSAPLA